MIDTDKLRRLAQAATPGPWKMLPVGDGRQKFAVADSEFLSILTVTDEGGATFGTVYDDDDARFIAAANPAAINELLDRLEAAEKERESWKGLAKQFGQEADALRAKIEQMERQEPVAWRTFDGEGGYDYWSYEDNENYKLWWNARNPNHIGWVEPLYLAPGAKGE